MMPAILVQEASRKAMIAVGQTAPDFSLKDQFGRNVTLEQFRGRQHVLLVSYPLDWTPT